LGKIPKNKRRAFTALRFLFKEGGMVHAARETAQLNIPKTVVFFDTKNETYWALEKCREWLEKSDKHQYTPRQIQCTIRVFHRTTAQHDKEATIAEFRQLAMEEIVPTYNKIAMRRLSSFLELSLCTISYEEPGHKFNKVNYWPTFPN
jgi:hypothetical protein